MMIPWLQWMGKLLAVLAAFVQQNPLPHAQRVAARRLAAEQALQVQYVPAAQPATEAPRETVLETVRQTESSGEFSRSVGYQWLARSTEPHVLILTREGKQIGAWYPATRKYLDFDAATGKWAVQFVQQCDGRGHCWLVEVPAFKDSPPVALPQPAQPPQPPLPGTSRQLSPAGQGPALTDNARCNGVHRDKMREPEAAEEITDENGNRVPLDHARRKLGAPMAGSPVDDSKWPVVTITGADAAARQRVLDDFDKAPELAEFKNSVLVKSLPPEHWHLAGSGFKTDGKPTIYIQAGNGQVLHRQDDYADGPAGLATALRKARPDYDPAKDPDLRKLFPLRPEPPKQPDVPTPEPAPADSGSGVWTLLVIVLVLGAIFLKKP